MVPSYKAELPDEVWDREQCPMRPSFRAKKMHYQIRPEKRSMPDGAQLQDGRKALVDET